MDKLSNHFSGKIDLNQKESLTEVNLLVGSYAMPHACLHEAFRRRQALCALRSFKH